MKEFTLAVEEAAAETDGTPIEEQYVEFKMKDVDGEGKVIGERELRAYNPTPGQLVFMLAATGRGQTKENRTAAIINIMMESLQDDDRDYFEGRLLAREQKRRLPEEFIGEMFEWLVTEWFARPTQPASDSVESSQTDGQK